MSVDNAKKIFDAKLKELSDAISDRSLLLDNARYAKILREVKEAQTLRENNQPLTSKQYRRLRRYDVMRVGDTERLIEGGPSETGNLNIRYYCKTEELFNILETAHVSIGHKRTRAMEAELKKKYCNVTRQVIDIFLTLCEQCEMKKMTPKPKLIVRPVLSDYKNSRCQVDLIDMQSEPDGDYQFIMNYQDHLTKFTILRPLKSKTAEEVAYQLMDIFCMFGAPFILQSGNGREFANKILQNLTKMWPGIKMVHGNPRHSQSQESVERSNLDVRGMLMAWMSENSEKTWSEGLRFIQRKMNQALHLGIKTSPFEAMFGTAHRLGLADSPFTEKVYSSIETEEELEHLFNAGMKNAREAEENEEADQQSIKDEDENQINETSGETTEKEDDEKVYCVVCEKESLDCQKCSVCAQFVHSICGGYTEGFGQKVTCNFCLGNNRINIEREDAKYYQEQQAKEIVSLSKSRIPKVDTERNAVRVPDGDRRHRAPKNILAVVDDANSRFHQLSSKEDLREWLLSRNEYSNADNNFIDSPDVPSCSRSLQSATVITPSGIITPSERKLGFISCTCKRYCIRGKCKCRSKNTKCNSKCHYNSPCKNK